MRHVYEVFERFPDSSTLWRASVRGRYEAQRKMQELAEHSPNEFLLINIGADYLPPTVSAQRNKQQLSKSAVAG
jgi:hypothetical protein